MVRKHWGVTRGATREERLAEVRRLNNDLRAGAGDPRAGAGSFTTDVPPATASAARESPSAPT